MEWVDDFSLLFFHCRYRLRLVFLGVFTTLLVDFLMGDMEKYDNNDFSH